MSRRIGALPAADHIDIAAELRRQLDDGAAKRVELEHKLAGRDQRIRELERVIAEGHEERKALRSTLLGEAELAEAQAEPHEKRGSAWWHAAWREVSRHRAELLLRVGQLERWTREGGLEATRLQTELTAARKEIGQLTRQLELARSGERCDVEAG